MDNEHWMRRCITLASHAEGWTTPNPMVGSVVLNANGECIAEGFHKGPGQWHAEREALLKLDSKAVNGTLYVNLEPCCVWGRTPPCTDIIIESGITSVFVGMIDPDPRMAGKGIAALRAAGVRVVVGLLERECRNLNAAYLCARLNKRPLVTLKVAATLDGRVRDVNGASKWITSPASRDCGQLLRSRNDAILVGVETVLADNPKLNMRLKEGAAIRPVVLDTHLRTPLDASLFTAGLDPWFYCSKENAEHVSMNSRGVTKGANGLCWDEILKDLQERGIYSLLVEGGPTIASSLLAEDRVDRLELFLAPMVLGGGLNWGNGLNLPLTNAHRFEQVDVQSVGPDLWIKLRRISKDV